MDKPIKGHNNLMLGTEKIGKLMWKFSIPAIISGLVGAGYNIVDQIFIGHGIGDLGMAATNIAFPLVTISTAFALLFGVGGASNFNLNMGRGKPDVASKSVGNAISWMVLSGIAVSIIAIIINNTFVNAVFLYLPIIFSDDVKYICKNTVIGNCIESSICEYINPSKGSDTKNIIIVDITNVATTANLL